MTNYHSEMKASEIEKAAKEYSPMNCDTREKELIWIAGASMVNEKQPYSKEDMIAWIKWYIAFGINHIKRNTKITDYELIKLWEESKNG